MGNQMVVQYGAPLAEIIGEAFANLRVQGRRSSLALLGIMIGTASIIAMLNIGHNAQIETLKLFDNLGIDTLQIQAIPLNAGDPGFDVSLVDRLPALDPDILSASPVATSRSPVSAGNQKLDMPIIGMPSSFGAIVKLSPRHGRLLRPIDDCGSVAVVGKAAAEKLSLPGAELRPGAKIGIGNYIFTVVGILQKMPIEPMNPGDYNESVIVPLACSYRVLATSKPNMIIAKIRRDADPDVTGAKISKILENPRSSIQIISGHMYIKTLNEQKAVHSRMLVAVGAVSLLVGGIGVMNVMLMGVMERRREIGLRAAIGATPRDLKTMFLIESATLAIAGGVSGTILGLLAAYFFSRSSGWTFVVNWPVLPLGPGVAGLVGLISGLYPAVAAARLRPIEALHAD